MFEFVNAAAGFRTALTTFLKNQRALLHSVRKCSPSFASRRCRRRRRRCHPMQSAAPGDVSGPIMRNTCWLTQIENTTRRGREELLLPARGQLMSPRLPITTNPCREIHLLQNIQSKEPCISMISERYQDVATCRWQANWLGIQK